MTDIPVAAVEAAAEAMAFFRVDEREAAQVNARAALTAALPLIREQLAQEIMALHPRGRISVPTFDQFDSPWSEGCLRCNSQTCRLDDAASIVRGDKP